MVFNTITEQLLAKDLVFKLTNVKGFSILHNACFDSSVRNFLIQNEVAIKSRDLSKFDPVCIMNGIHAVSVPIHSLFQSGNDITYLWKLLQYLLFVYDPFYELDKEEIYEINEFVMNFP